MWSTPGSRKVARAILAGVRNFIREPATLDAHHVADPQSAVALLTSLTLDSEQFIRDVNSDHTSDTITQDITDGKLLKVAATPQFFVNGKPLTDFGYKQLALLVEEAVSESY